MSDPIECALTKKIYIISGKYSALEWTFKSLEDNKIISEQKFNKDNFSCSCQDYSETKRPCKHLLHLICKVALMIDIGKNLSKWCGQYFEACSNAWKAKLGQFIKNKPDEETVICPICFDDLNGGGGENTECYLSCRTKFHAECIDMWEKINKNSCPMCRNNLYSAGDAKLDITPEIIFNIEDEIEEHELMPDILFTFDTTGSMYPCIKEVRRNIAETAKKLFKEIPNLRMAIMAHGDYCDEKKYYLTKHIDFTSNVEEIVEFVNNVGGTYGGDFPEAYEYVLRESRKLSWRIESTAKSLVMIGDAPPHEKDENPEKIDWRLEADRLKDRNVQIFSIQCLNSGNQDSFDFYSTISTVTNGYHLFLNQFSYVTDMIEAICYKQHDTTQLEEFEHKVQNRNGGMTDAMRLMFDTMLGRKTREQVTSEMNPSTFKARYRAPKPKTSISVPTSSESDLSPCLPTKFQVFNVTEDIAIKPFCESMGISYKTGRGFYEFTKSETIQASKEIILMKKSDGSLYEGAAAKNLAGITSSGRFSPGSVENYRVFVQSKSTTRKLISGQGFLYEVSYE